MSDIVVAHFNEDLDWLGDHASNATVYYKGAAPSGRFRACHKLPNVGRESHTFLHHIVHNYDRLSFMTIFLQGNIHDERPATKPHTHLPLDEIVNRSAEFTNGQVYPISRVYDFRQWDGLPFSADWLVVRGSTLRSSKLTPAQFWKVIFGKDHPLAVRQIGGALMGVTRAAIRRQPLTFYQGLLAYFNDLGEVDPEEGHYMERFWFSIFSEEGIKTARTQSAGLKVERNIHSFRKPTNVNASRATSEPP